jgi:hypothetical protein
MIADRCIVEADDCDDTSYLNSSAMAHQVALAPSLGEHRDGQQTGKEAMDCGDELTMGTDDCDGTSYQNGPLKGHHAFIAPLLGEDRDRQSVWEEVVDGDDEILLRAYDCLQEGRSIYKEMTNVFRVISSPNAY